MKIVYAIISIHDLAHAEGLQIDGYCNGFDSHGTPECRFYPETGRIEDDEVQEQYKKLGESLRRDNKMIEPPSEIELQRLQSEDAKYDKFRCLPLYSCRCTGYRFFCSPRDAGIFTFIYLFIINYMFLLLTILIVT